MIENQQMPDRAVMVGVATPMNPFEKTQEYLEELSFLIDTAGGVAVKSFIQRLPYNDPRTFVGSGKLEEIKEYINAEEIQFVVFDDELSPSQMRNIENQLKDSGNSRYYKNTRNYLKKTYAISNNWFYNPEKKKVYKFDRFNLIVNIILILLNI